jgi:hypothetical protein
MRNTTVTAVSVITVRRWELLVNRSNQREVLSIPKVSELLKEALTIASFVVRDKANVWRHC